jgi:hypothetical protein
LILFAEKTLKVLEENQQPSSRFQLFFYPTTPKKPSQSGTFLPLSFFSNDTSQNKTKQNKKLKYAKYEAKIPVMLPPRATIVDDIIRLFSRKCHAQVKSSTIHVHLM